MTDRRLPRKEARIVTEELRAVWAAIDAVLMAPRSRSLHSEEPTMADLMAMLDYSAEILIVLRNEIAGYIEDAIAQISILSKTEEELFDAIEGKLSPRSLTASIAAAVADTEGAKEGLRRLRNRIRAGIDGLYGAAGSARAGAHKALRWIKSIMSWLKGVCASLWSMLARLNTPVEWKLSGKVGTGALGLLDVGIEITFRADDEADA